MTTGAYPIEIYFPKTGGQEILIEEGKISAPCTASF